MPRCCLVTAFALFVIASSAAATSAAPGDPVPAADDWRVKGALAALDSGDPALVPRAIILLADLNVVSAFDRIAASGEKLLASDAIKKLDGLRLRDAVAYALATLQMRSEISIPLLLRLAEKSGMGVYSEPCAALDSWRFAEDISAPALSALRTPSPDYTPPDWYACAGVWDVAGLEVGLSLPEESNQALLINQRISFSAEIDKRLTKVEERRRQQILAQRELAKPAGPAPVASLLTQLQKIGEAPADASHYFQRNERRALIAIAAQRDEARAAKLRPALLSHLDAKLREVAAARAGTDEELGYALLAVGPLTRTEALDLIGRTYHKPGLGGEQIDFLRFWAIALSGADPVVTTAARWLASTSPGLPRVGPNGQRVHAATLMDVLRAAASPSGDLKISGADVSLQGNAVGQLLKVLQETKWIPADQEFLEGLRDALKEPQYEEVRRQIQLALDGLSEPPEPPHLRVLRWLNKALGIHFMIWLAVLLTIYPRSRTVQAVMLFNPIGRAITGLGYTQLAVLVLPWLRRRLFRPLVRAATDAERASFDAASFYDRVQVARLVVPMNPQAPVKELAPVAWTELVNEEGLIIIEGASGLGKTHVLKALLERATAAGRTCLFLRAAECNGGLLKEIEERLAVEHASGFVRSLLHRGAIELFIDGLNEASPSGVAAIVQFCENATAARILVTTQPMTLSWPPRAKRFRLLPLAPDELEAFLRSQWPAVRPAAALATPADETAAEAAYLERIRTFLDGRTSPSNLAVLPQNRIDLAVLQNRIDLSFVAHLLARAEVPDIHSLRKQVVDDAARAYEAASPGGTFPLAALAATAVRVLETGRPTLVLDGLDPAVLPHLAERKLLLRRGEAEWLFRHDTITSYFAAAGSFAPKIVATAGDDGDGVLDPQALTEAHLQSPRFVGVYLQLAESLPLPAAEALAAALREHGRKSGDRTLEIAYQDRLDRRTKT